MSQAVEAFRQISWLIFKWLLIAVGVLIVLALLLGGGVWGFNWSAMHQEGPWRRYPSRSPHAGPAAAPT
jgi:hypothetical protein